MPVRLAVSGIAARMGMSVDDLEDLRSAVSEACVWAMDGMGEGSFCAEVRVEEDLLVNISVVGERERERDVNGEVLEISRMMTEALCLQ